MFAIFGMLRNVSRRLLDRHVEDVGDRRAFVRDLQRLAVVAAAAADIARDVDVGQEVHLDLDLPVALARLAASALHVERETSRPVAAHARFRRLRHQVADLGEELRVRRGIRARRAADRRLVDVDDFVELIETFDDVVFAGDVRTTRRSDATAPCRGCRSRASTCPSRRRRSRRRRRRAES